MAPEKETKSSCLRAFQFLRDLVLLGWREAHLGFPTVSLKNPNSLLANPILSGCGFYEIILFSSYKLLLPGNRLKRFLFQ